MNQYNSYHTSIKLLTKRNKLPDKYLSCIDRSTIWKWKKKNDNMYIGLELSNVDLLENFFDRQESAAIIRTCLKLTAALSKILNESCLLQKVLHVPMHKRARVATTSI